MAFVSSSLLRQRKWLVGTLVTGSLAYAEYQRELSTGNVGGPFRVVEGVHRFAKAAGNVAWISADYKWSGSSSEVHQRSADRLVRTFLDLGGIFIKAGQHVASLNHVLPNEWVQTFKQCQDQAPFRPGHIIQRYLEQELGRPVHEMYAEFEELPIAAASLAQVHRARLRSDPDKMVAVKIQYPELQRTVAVDVQTIAFLCRCVEWVFPQFKLGWLIREFNANLPQEMDFVQEGRNCDRVRQLMGHRKDVVVPTVEWPLTSRRVITLEFMDGVKINDVTALENIRMSRRKVSHLLADVFSELIFDKGFVHADCHPGNLMVNRHHQLVLLDHGLYRELSDGFRLAYASLWLNLLLRQPEEVKKTSLILGVKEENYPLLATMILSRSWEHGSKGYAHDISDEELRELRRVGSENVANMTDVLASVPQEMLLLFKTNDLMRSVQMDLGMNTDYFLTFIGRAISALRRPHFNHPGCRDDLLDRHRRYLLHEHNGWTLFWSMWSLRLVQWLKSWAVLVESWCGGQKQQRLEETAFL